MITHPKTSQRKLVSAVLSSGGRVITPLYFDIYSDFQK